MEWNTFMPGAGNSYATGSHSFGHAPTGHPDHSSGASWALLGSNKVPPYCGTELAESYPYRVWLQDLQLWAQSTDLEEVKLGPAVAGRLGGVARSLAREMPIELIRDGQRLSNGQVLNGMECLVRALTRRFGPLSFETCLTSMIEYLQFRRGSHENIDQALTRWEILKARANENGGLVVSPSGRALMLLTALHVSRSKWPLILIATNGLFPQSDDEVDALAAKLRHECHLTEERGSSSSRFFTGFGEDADPLQQNDPWAGAVSPSFGGCEPQHEDWQAYVEFDDSGFPSCTHCGQWLYGDSATNEDPDLCYSDYGSTVTDDDGLFNLSTAAAAAQLGQPGELEDMKQEYMFFKKRFRHYAGRFSRRARFPRRLHIKGRGKGFHHRSKGKGKSGGKPPFGSWYGDSDALGGCSLAGGKDRGGGGKHGDGKGKKGKGKGKGMKCFRCGQPGHFARDCPQGKGRPYNFMDAPQYGDSGAQALALPASSMPATYGYAVDDRGPFAGPSRSSATWREDEASSELHSPGPS